MTDSTDTIELIDRAEIKDGKAIVAYSRTEAALAELRAKYQDARYDLSTTAGDKAARAARLELTTTRTSLEKKRKELKAPAVEFGRKVDAEAARLTGELLALENPIDAQIKADERRREDERSAREEAEAARKKVHTDAIAKIAGYVAQAAEMPSARIAAGLAFLEGMELTGFEEFTEEAAATRQRTVAALQAMFAKAKARENEEARLKAEREEQARVAAEQAETARQLKAEQDELARQREVLAAEQRRQEAERERIRREEQERADQEAANTNRMRMSEISGIQQQVMIATLGRAGVRKGGTIQCIRETLAETEAWPIEESNFGPLTSMAQAAKDKAVAEIRDLLTAAEAARIAAAPAPTQPPAAEPIAAPAVSSQAANVVPMGTRAPDTGARIRLDEINVRLAPIALTADGLAQLGFQPVATEKAAKLYAAGDFQRICAALIAHVSKVSGQQRAA